MLTWMRSVDDGRQEVEDRVGYTEPGNWMSQPSVAVAEAVFAAVYVHGSDTAGSVELMFCRVGMVERVAVIWTEESIGKPTAEDMTPNPELNGVGLFQAAYAAWADDRAGADWTMSEQEVQSGWEEARLGP